MATWRQAVELAMSDEEIGRLAAIARSRSEPARRVERARMLLAYCESRSFYAVGQRSVPSARAIDPDYRRATGGRLRVNRGPLGLDERGIPAARGGKWSAVQVARLSEAAQLGHPFGEGVSAAVA